MNCVAAVQPSTRYFHDIDVAVDTFLAKQSYVPSMLLKYCKSLR